MNQNSSARHTPVRANPSFPPWGYVRSTELARLCGVSMQTVWNWRVRGQGPAPTQDRSRRNWYRLADVQSWLEKERSSEDIIIAWIRERFPHFAVTPDNLTSLTAFLEEVKLVEKTRKPEGLLVPKFITAA
jgi:hypothetical protein